MIPPGLDYYQQARISPTCRRRVTFMPLTNRKKRDAANSICLLRCFSDLRARKKWIVRLLVVVVVGTLFSQYGLEEFLKDTATCFFHLTSPLPL